MAKNRDNVSPLKRIGEDSLIYLLATIIPAVLSFLTVPIYTRIFKPQEFGYYAIATTTIALLTSIFSGWLAQVSLRFYESSRKANELHIYHSTIFFSLIAVTSISAPILILLLYLFKSDLGQSLSLILTVSIFCFFANGIYKVYLTILRASQQPKFYGLIEISNSTIRLGIALLAILLLGFGVDGILYGFLISMLFALWLIFKKLDIKSQLSFKNFSGTRFREYFSFGYPLSFALISSWLMTLSNRYVIGLLQDSGEVGLYSVSSQLSDRPLRLIFTGIMLAAYPIILEQWENEGKESTENLINKLSRYYIIISIPFLILLSIFAKEILLLLTTEKYIEGFKAVPYIAVGMFFFGLSQYLAKAFELNKLTSKLAIYMFTMGIMNLALTMVLVSKIGFVGAGISMMLSYISLFFFFWYKIRPYLNWFISQKSILRILLASGAIASFLYYTKSYAINSLITIILFSGLSLILYTIILILSGEINAREVKALGNFLKS